MTYHQVRFTRNKSILCSDLTQPNQLEVITLNTEDASQSVHSLSKP